MDEKKILPIIEGMLFINGDEGTDITEIIRVLNIDKKKILLLIELLKNKYEKNNHGITVVKFAKTKFRITTRIEDHEYYIKFRKNFNEKKLSQAALEVLSIVAYKGPITKHQIENIRGVCSDSVVYKLKNLELIKETGRSETPGRPFLYVITKKFMKIFNLNSLNELPKVNLNIETISDDLFK